MEITDYKKFKIEAEDIVKSHNVERASNFVTLNKTNMKTLKEDNRFLWELLRSVSKKNNV